MTKIHLIGPNFSKLEEEMVLDALRNGWNDDFDLHRRMFEKEFAEHHNRKFGIFTPSCTSAIHLALLSLGIKKDDEVIVPEITWIASAAPIIYCGATPVFIDIDRRWCSDPLSLQKNITSRTKAIIVVDLYGNMPDFTLLEWFAKEANIPLIEDAAQAFGASYLGRKAGNFGDISVFSFHPSKTLTTCEGGMLLTDDEEIYQRAMFLRNHGKSKKKLYFNDEVAHKMIGSNILAALGRAQLKRADELHQMKKTIFNYFKDRLEDLEGIEMNNEGHDVENGYWLPSIVAPSWNKEEVVQHFADLGIQMRPFFYPLSSLPAFDHITTWEKSKYPKRNPNAYSVSKRGINLPANPKMTLDDIDFICDEVRKLWK